MRYTLNLRDHDARPYRRHNDRRAATTLHVFAKERRVGRQRYHNPDGSRRVRRHTIVASIAIALGLGGLLWFLSVMLL